MQLPSVRNGSATRGLMSAPRPMKKCKACGRDAVRTEPTAAEQPGIFTLHQSIKAPKHFASLRGLTQLFFFSWVVFSPRICHSHSCQTLSLSGRCTSLIRSWPHTNTHKMLKCLSLALWLFEKKKNKKMDRAEIKPTTRLDSAGDHGHLRPWGAGGGRGHRRAAEPQKPARPENQNGSQAALQVRSASQ